MHCEDARLLLHALLDDELDPAAGLAVTRHLAGCTACSRRLQAQAALRDALRGGGLYQPAPAALRERIRVNWPRTPRAARAWRRASPLALAALAALFVAASLLAGWQTARVRSLHADSLAAQAVSAHLRSLLPGHLIDVPTSDEHTVKPWFDGRLDFSPLVKDLAAQGFVLAGGRLDVLGDRRVAAIVYRRRLHVINLFEWPDARPAPTATSTHNGYHVVQWDEAGLRLLAVSDVSPADLEAFVRAFRAGAAPADTRAH